MAGTWAISGVDLHLDLVGTSMRAGLESALREAVSTGRLPPGSRLPSSRALAADLGIARNTVAEAYAQLVAEGWADRAAGLRNAGRETAGGDRAVGAGSRTITLGELIVSGAYDRHVRRSRLVYRRRRDRLMAALARHLHALVELPGGASGKDIVARAAKRGLAIQGLGGYAYGSYPHPPALVIGYAKPPEHAFTAAVARLAAVLREAIG